MAVTVVEAGILSNGCCAPLVYGKVRKRVANELTFGIMRDWINAVDGE